MSEISDAVQIIRVGYDTIEIAMKVGSGSIEMMQKAVNLLIGLLEHEKTMGKTNLKGLLEKGGDIQVLTFADEDLKKFQKLAKKYGILYSVMPDADRKDGITEVLFHSEAAPRLRMICQKLKKHYDRVERTVRERYQKVKQSPDKNVVRTHSEVRRR